MISIGAIVWQVLAGMLDPAGASGVAVVDEAPAERCPEKSDVDAALVRRLGDAPAPTHAWTLRYRSAPRDAASAASAGAVEMSLGDDEARVHVSRRIPLGGSPCAAAADAMAIIVERYFREIGWTRGTPLPAPMAPPPPAPEPVLPAQTPPVVAAAGPEAAGAPTADSPEAQPSATPKRRVLAPPSAQSRFPLGVEAAIEPALLVGGGTSPLLGLGLGFRIGPVIAGATVFVPAVERDESIGGGSVRATSIPIAAAVHYQIPAGGFFVRYGVDALLRSESGEGVNLVNPQGGSRTFVSAGGGVEVGRQSGAGLAALAASFFYTLPAGDFLVGGVGSVLEPPRFQVLVGIRLAVGGP